MLVVSFIFPLRDSESSRVSEGVRLSFCLVFMNSDDPVRDAEVGPRSLARDTDTGSSTRTVQDPFEGCPVGRRRRADESFSDRDENLFMSYVHGG